MDIQKLNITWLGPCPTCERTEHKVKTIKGTKDHLYEDDEVKCWCGQTGLIETDCMGNAWCEWYTKAITEYDKFNAYYRKKYPEYWVLLPSCNHQACTHHEGLFNSWLNAKAQAMPEGFVSVPKDIISVLEELTQFSSYAEIVGGISVNRAAIREQCDIAFTLIREFEDTESLKEIKAQEQSHD